MTSRYRPGTWLPAVPMFLLALATIYPLLFTANVAMKTRREYVLDRFSPAGGLRGENLVTAWTSVGMGGYFVNSLIVVTSAVLLLLLFGSMAGFALSRLRFRGSSVLYLACLAGLFVPFQVIMVPLARIMADAALIDTYPGLVLVYVAQFLPFTVFLMTSYYRTIPQEVIDAARIDGVSTLGFYTAILLPISKPAIATVAVLTTLATWNELLLALLFVQDPARRTLPAGMVAFQHSHATDYPALLAGLAMISGVSLLAYVVCNRQVVQGVAEGAVK